jgi:uncharacterized protein with NRDE domain
MCLILLAINQHPEYQLVLAANRDEFYQRPTLPAGPWTEAPDVIGGRDLEKGGSWLAVSRTGRFAAVTNFREPVATNEPPLSRGLLVSDFVSGDETPGACLDRVGKESHRYRGFSLLVGERTTVGYVSNRGSRMLLEAGLYGIGNALLDTPWPKVLHGKRNLSRLLQEPELDPQAIFTLLADPSQPWNGARMPKTPGEETEPLDPIFVQTSTFGTRCSSLLLIHRTGRITFMERSFAADGKSWREERHDLC